MNDGTFVLCIVGIAEQAYLVSLLIPATANKVFRL